MIIYMVISYCNIVLSLTDWVILYINKLCLRILYIYIYIYILLFILVYTL